MQTPETIDGMRVICWAELSGLPVPWERFPLDVVERWQHLVYGVICVTEDGGDDTREYHFMMCDEEWDVGASDFSYTLDGARTGLATELMIDQIHWNDAYE